MENIYQQQVVAHLRHRLTSGDDPPLDPDIVDSDLRRWPDDELNRSISLHRLRMALSIIGSPVAPIAHSILTLSTRTCANGLTTTSAESDVAFAQLVPRDDMGELSSHGGKRCSCSRQDIRVAKLDSQPTTKPLISTYTSCCKHYGFMSIWFN